MKKNKVKVILITLIIVICLNIGVYAAYVLSATDVNYTKSDGTTVSVKAALDELYTIHPLAEVVSVGDYVAYDATNNYSYTSPKGTGTSHGNGYGSQTFTSSSDLKWRVFGWDDETGGVILISEKPIGNFIMDYVVGYLYAEQELNELCSIYGYGNGANTSKSFNYLTGDIVDGKVKGTKEGSGARSINVYDINTIMGYDNEEMFTHYGGNTVKAYYPTLKTTTGISSATSSRYEPMTLCIYSASDYLNTNNTMYKMLFNVGDTEEKASYYLASRYKENNTYNWCLYGLRGVEVGNVNDFYPFFEIDSSGVYEMGSEKGYGIRPLVYLSPDVETNEYDPDTGWSII